MKHLKKLGLVAVAAMALIAFVGASSASATVLCETTSTPCSKKWPKGTQLEYIVKPGTVAFWITGISKNECTEGTLKATMLNEGSSTESVRLSVAASDFSWNSCTFSNKTLEGGELVIHSIAGSNHGTMTMKGFVFRTDTPNYGSCTYGAPSAVHLGQLTASGSGESLIDIDVTLPRTGGSFLCPTTMEWWETWVQTKPEGKALYVEPS